MTKPRTPPGVRRILTEEGLHALQRNTFRYFWSETNPENGLLADNTLGDPWEPYAPYVPFFMASMHS